MLARLSILKKLLLPTLAMILVGAGVIFYSMSSLARMYDMMETSIELRTNRLVYTLEIQEALYSAADKEKAAILASDGAAVKESADALAEEIGTANESTGELVALAKTTDDAKDDEQAAAIQQDVQKFAQIEDQVLSLAAEQRDAEALALAKGAAFEARDGADLVGDEIREVDDAALIEAQTAADDLFITTKETLLASSTIGLTFAAALMLWIIIRHVSAPINMMAGSMLKVANGDLAIEIAGLNRRDEVGGMARALQVFKVNAVDKKRLESEAAEKLAEERAREEAQLQAEREVQQELAALVDAAAAGDMSRRVDLAGKQGLMLKLGEGMNRWAATMSAALEQVIQVMSGLARGDLSKRIEGEFRGDLLRLKTDTNATAEKLADVVGQVVDGTSMIKAAMGQLSEGSTDLSTRTEEQVASLEEMAAAIRQMAVTVKQTADNAQQASRLAETARSAAQGGGEVAAAAINAVGDIQASSQRITEIVSMMDEIAFQTNLLALNAAVEAARAGDAGRGFAVVAAEVRALAQRSSTASKEIKGLIGVSNQNVEKGVALVNKAGTTLGDIVTSVRQAAEIVSTIATASAEQSKGVQQIDDTVSALENVTQKNAALVEESTAALGAVDNQVNELALVAGFFGGAGASARSAGAGTRTLQKSLPGRVGAATDAATPAAPAGAAGGREKLPYRPRRQARAASDSNWDSF
jgi:methyl-accepting chemotaxis protein